MSPDAIFYRDLAYVFGAAVLGGVLARLARQPLILGYVVGGILVSPVTPGPALSELHAIEVFRGVTAEMKLLTQIGEVTEPGRRNVYRRPDGSLTHW